MVRQHRFTGNGWKHCVDGDGVGYYAYLPWFFIYHQQYRPVEIARKNIFTEGEPNEVGPLYITDQLSFDKCFVGVAVLMAPFFLLAMLISALFHLDMGGYSVVFQESVSAASVFYLLVGLIFVRKMLKEYNISEYLICFILLMLTFGTNLYYYACCEQSMSHQYTFCFVAMFLYYTKKAVNDTRLKYVLLMAVALAITSLIRPSNIIAAVALPFMAGSPKVLKEFLLKILRPKLLGPILGTMAAIGGIQILVWYMETGQPFIWSYKGESFDFAHPHFLDELISYRKGFFVYTPLMFVVIVSGLITFFKNDRYAFFCYALFFVAVNYLLSSWWAWYYGGSFGLRAYIDFYAFFILGLVLFYARSRSMVMKVVVTLLCLLCFYANQIMVYQYTTGILRWDRIDKDRFWRRFLRTDPRAPGFDPFPDSTGIQFFKGVSSLNSFDTKDTLWNASDAITGEMAHSAKLSSCINKDHIYSSALRYPVKLIPADTGVYVYVTLWVYAKEKTRDGAIVVSLEDKDGKPYFYSSWPIGNFMFHANQWQEAGMSVKLPPIKNNDDRVLVYAFAAEQDTRLYIDDFYVRFGKSVNK
jgi:hypothetical protein